MGSRTNKNKGLRGLVSRLPVLALLCFLLFQLAACTGESMQFFGNPDPVTKTTDFLDRAWEKEPVNPFGGNYALTPERLTQEMALLMNNPDQIDRVYAQLPAQLRSNISVELFRRYLEALRPAGGEKIVSFEELSEEEVQGLQSAILANHPELTDEVLTSRYFSLVYHPVTSKRRIEREVKNLVLAIQTADGQATVSAEWADATVRIHDYALLYFDALSNEVLKHNDISSLAWFQQESEPLFSGEEWERYSYRKAKLTGQYYQSTVTTEPNASACLYLLPGVAAYRQEYRYGQDLSATRTVRFQEKNGVYTVLEPIPDEQGRDEEEIRIYGHPLLMSRVGIYRRDYSSDDVHPLAGEILSIAEYNPADPAKLKAALEAGKKFYEISYYGFKLRVLGAADEAAKEWSGSIVSVILESRICSLGKALRPGMREAELHNVFPFIRENNGEITGSGEPFSRMILSYTADKGTITRIIFDQVR